MIDPTHNDADTVHTCPKRHDQAHIRKHTAPFTSRMYITCDICHGIYVCK